jgi:hypothetical protein
MCLFDWLTLKLRVGEGIRECVVDEDGEGSGDIEGDGETDVDDDRDVDETGEYSDNSLAKYSNFIDGIFIQSKVSCSLVELAIRFNASFFLLSAFPLLYASLFGLLDA